MNMNRSRLGIVVNDLGFLDSHRRPLVEAALKEGFEVNICAPEDPGSNLVRDYESSGCRYVQVGMSRSGKNLKREVATYRRILEVYRAIQPDLVHTVTVKPNLYGGLAARRVGVPALVCSVSGLGHLFLAEGLKSGLERTLITSIYRRVFRHPQSRVILQNSDDASLFRDLGIAKDAQIEIIRGSGVDLDKFVQTREPPGTPVVLFAARLLREKGIEEFLLAAQILLSSGLDAKFVIAGDLDPGNPSSLSQEEIGAWGSTKGIEWVGYRADMAQILAACSVVCLPSWREGFPKLLMEASACGRPVVTTDVAGCREVVRHRENGLLAPVKDPEALALQIGTLLDDRQLRSRLGEQGRRRAEAEFGDATLAAETIAIYSDLLKTR